MRDKEATVATNYEATDNKICCRLCVIENKLPNNQPRITFHVIGNTEVKTKIGGL
jgi:hypothetical protein